MAMMNRQERHNEEKLNRFNNNKTLTVQDESDMNTPEEGNTPAQYTTVTQCRRHCMQGLHFL